MPVKYITTIETVTNRITAVTALIDKVTDPKSIERLNSRLAILNAELEQLQRFETTKGGDH